MDRWLIYILLFLGICILIACIVWLILPPPIQKEGLFNYFNIENYLQTLPTTQARYIRIRSSTVGGTPPANVQDGKMTISQIQVIDMNGNNIALNANVTATSTDVGSAPVSVIVDGTADPRNDAAKVWTSGIVSTAANPQYIEIDLGSIQQISQIVYIGQGNSPTVAARANGMQLTLYTQTAPSLLPSTPITKQFITRDIIQVITFLNSINLTPYPTGNSNSIMNPSIIPINSPQPEVFILTATDVGMMTKTQAQFQCSQLGGTLATLGQLTNAYNNGAEWCFPGWVEDKDDAYLPIKTASVTCGTSISTSIPNLSAAIINNLKTGTGILSIPAGFLNNTSPNNPSTNALITDGTRNMSTAFTNANCFGIKPSQSTSSAIKNFNANSWSQYSSTNTILAYFGDVPPISVPDVLQLYSLVGDPSNQVTPAEWKAARADLSGNDLYGILKTTAPFNFLYENGSIPAADITRTYANIKIFGTATAAAVKEMNDSIDLCKRIFIGSPTDIDKYINISYANFKPYIRSQAGYTKFCKLEINNTFDNTTKTFKLEYSQANATFNSANCNTELTSDMIGLLPSSVTSYITKWIYDRVKRVKSHKLGQDLRNKQDILNKMLPSDPTNANIPKPAKPVMPVKPPAPIKPAQPSGDDLLACENIIGGVLGFVLRPNDNVCAGKAAEKAWNDAYDAEMRRYNNEINIWNMAMRDWERSPTGIYTINDRNEAQYNVNIAQAALTDLVNATTYIVPTVGGEQALLNQQQQITAQRRDIQQQLRAVKDSLNQQAYALTAYKTSLAQLPGYRNMPEFNSIHERITSQIILQLRVLDIQQRAMDGTATQDEQSSLERISRLPEDIQSIQQALEMMTWTDSTISPTFNLATVLTTMLILAQIQVTAHQQFVSPPVPVGGNAIPINITSVVTLDSIAQSFYEAMGGNYIMSNIYDVYKVGGTILDVRFDLIKHADISAIQSQIASLKAKYYALRASKVTQDILDSAKQNYQTSLENLQTQETENTLPTIAGVVGRFFYTFENNSVTITGFTLDARAVTSFIPELNCGIAVPTGGAAGMMSYEPNTVFTKNMAEPLQCNHPDTIRRIIEDYEDAVTTDLVKELSSATPSVDITKGSLRVSNVTGAAQIGPLQCALTWRETQYNDISNIPISAALTNIQRSAVFSYTGNTEDWYASDITIDICGFKFFPNSQVPECKFIPAEYQRSVAPTLDSATDAAITDDFVTTVFKNGNANPCPNSIPNYIFNVSDYVNSVVQRDLNTTYNNGGKGPINVVGLTQYYANTGIYTNNEIVRDAQPIPNLQVPINIMKKMPWNNTLDSANDVCPITSCEDLNVLYSLVDQYNNDPTQPGSILRVMRAYTANPYQCDMEYDINYDINVKDGNGRSVRKGSFVYNKNGDEIPSNITIPTGVITSEKRAFSTHVDLESCTYVLDYADIPGSGTSIQGILGSVATDRVITPPLYTPMEYATMFQEKNSVNLTASITNIAADISGANISAVSILEKYRTQTYAAVGDITSLGAGRCQAKCSDTAIMNSLIEYYKTQNVNTKKINTIQRVGTLNSTTCDITFQEDNYCSKNEIALPTFEFDQTIIFNIEGRYLRIYASQISGDGFLHLSQVVVNNATGTNIALNKPTFATSNLDGSLPPSSVVDGTLTSRLWPFFHAKHIGRESEYWQVDLGSIQSITSVRIINRNECCHDRIKGMRVRVYKALTDTIGGCALTSQTSGLRFTMAAQLTEGLCGPAREICKAPNNYCFKNEIALPTDSNDQTIIFNIEGRYLRIYPSQISGDGFLHLSQVVVNDATGTNIALNKPAFGTTRYGGSASASSVVDGYLIPRGWPFFHTGDTKRETEYWQVDLGSVQFITSVRIINRNDGLTPERILGMRVRVYKEISDILYPLGKCIAPPTPTPSNCTFTITGMTSILPSPPWSVIRDMAQPISTASTYKAGTVNYVNPQKEAFKNYGAPIQVAETTYPLNERAFGLDMARNKEGPALDSRFQVPLKQTLPPETAPSQSRPMELNEPSTAVQNSYKYLRFRPILTRDPQNPSVDISKMRFFLDKNEIDIGAAKVTNPMGTWIGSVGDITGPGYRRGWSDSHKKALMFALPSPILLNGFSWTTASPDKGFGGDPIQWKLEGSTNGVYWTTLHQPRHSFPVTKSRFQDLPIFRFK